MRNRVLTTDELVAMLKRTSLPTVLVEGTTDRLVLFRAFEKLFVTVPLLDLVPCGGRSQLLEIFSRRNEFAGKQVAFLADRDMWLFGKISPNLLDIIWTSGYSIENDVYNRVCEKLLTKKEYACFQKSIHNVTSYFAYVVIGYRKDPNNYPKHDLHPNQILDADHEFASDLSLRTGYVRPAPTDHDYIHKKFRLRLRGHTLFQCLLRFLSHSARDSKYSESNVLEICFATSQSAPLKKLVKRIVDQLGLPSPP